MLSKTAIQSAVQGAILAGAALFLALPACVVAEDITILAPGAGGGGDGLSDPFGGGSTGKAGATRKTPTPGPGAKASPGPSGPGAPTPTPPPVVTRTGLASDFWIEQNSGVTADLHGVVAMPPTSDKAQVWAVGNAGTILYSPDAGKSWVKQDSRTTKDLYSIAYDFTPGILLAGGADGTLLMTTDNGATWSALPTPVASGSTDAPGTIRQVDIWTVGLQGRRAPFISTDRFPLLGARDVRKPFEDENDPPLPKRNRLTWDFDLNQIDTPTRFSFYRVTSVNAYGLVGVGDRTKALCESTVCIGWPDVGKEPISWRWRPKTTFDGATSPEGQFTDIATVPDWQFECGELNGGGPLPAILATDKALYRTTDYGTTWKKLNGGPPGANRIFTLGRGRIVAVSATKIWYGTAQFPNAACPKGEPMFLWQQVTLTPGDLDVDLNDQFLAGVKASDTLSKPADIWIVGRGGRIVYRKAQ